MRAMIALSFFVASVTCEAFYAPNFAYPGAGLPYAAAGLPYGYHAGVIPAYTYTALDTYHYNRFPALATATAINAPVIVASDAAVAAEVAVEPAVKLLESEKVEKVAAEGEAIEVDVVEADDSPIIPTGPIEIRRIFPIFDSDLRGAVTNVNFLRPSQVRPILPEADDNDVSVVVPAFKSLPLTALPFQARF